MITIVTARRSQHSQECKDSHRQCFFVTCYLDLLTTNISGYPELVLGHFCVIFGDLSYICF